MPLASPGVNFIELIPAHGPNIRHSLSNSVSWRQRVNLGFSQRSCHQGPFHNRRDLEPIDSKEPDPHAAFAKIVFEVYYPRISYEHSLSDFLFPQTPLVLSVTRSRVSLDCQ